MKMRNKVFALALVVSLCMSVFTTGNAVGEDTDLESSNPMYGSCAPQNMYIDSAIDTTQGYVHSDGVIPVEFSLHGTSNTDEITLDIVSTMQITHSVDWQTQSDGSKVVQGEITIQSEPTEQAYDSVSFDNVTITVRATDEENSEDVVSLEIFVLNSQYGLFVGYINEECLQDFFVQWLHENDLITSASYDEYVTNKRTAVPISNDEYAAVLDGTKAVRAVSAQQTCVYVQYSVMALNGGSRLTVSGSITWTDMRGGAHPAQGIKVEVLDDDVTVNDTLGTAYTSSTGAFSLTFDNQTGINELGGCDLFLTVYASSENVVVDDTFGSAYSFDVVIGDNISSSISQRTQSYGPNNTSNAFQIHQAIYLGAKYYKSMTNTSAPTVTVGFPYSDSLTTMYVNSRIYVQASTYYSWDVMLHEYGHFVADIFGFHEVQVGNHYLSESIIDTKLGGDNDVTLADLDNVKEAACRLAWSEGWATYFSISCQSYEQASQLGVPYVGNILYEDLSSTYYCDNIESYIGKGEASERAVFCILWDLADSPSMAGALTESHDSIGIGFKTVWNRVMSSNAKTLSQFMGYLYSLYSKTSFIYMNLGAILAVQNVTAASLSDSGDMTAFSCTRKTGTQNCVDTYWIEFYDASTLNIIYSFSMGTTNNRFLMSTEVANNLKSNYANGVYWCIKAVPIGTYSTGPYYSSFAFLDPTVTILGAGESDETA